MRRPVRSADIVELRAFCAAVELGSIGRAARLLRVSQPALSKRLRGLEALAAADLLDRSPRGVSPTPAGARLYAEARRLLTQAEAVESLLAGLDDDESPVRVAASHTIAEFVLPQPLVEFEGRHEHHLSVELIVANSDRVRDLVREGRVEFGIAAARGSLPDSSLEELPFREDEVIVAVPPGHPWNRAEEIDLDEFVATPMVLRDPSADTRRVVDEALAARGLALAPSLAEVGSTSAAKATALSESAPVLLSRLAVAADPGGLAARRVRGVVFKRRFVFLFAGEETLTAPARALLRHLAATDGHDSLPDHSTSSHNHRLGPV